MNQSSTTLVESQFWTCCSEIEAAIKKFTLSFRFGFIPFSDGDSLIRLSKTNISQQQTQMLLLPPIKRIAFVIIILLSLPVQKD